MKKWVILKIESKSAFSTLGIKHAKKSTSPTRRRIKNIGRNPSDADSAMGTVTATTISRENSSRLSLPSIHYNHEDMKSHLSRLTPKNSFSLKKNPSTINSYSNSFNSTIPEDETVPRKFLRGLNMTPNQIEVLTRQDKLGESSTIKMSYKFAGISENQTSLNNMVQQLGSVESLFESPECIAELIASQREKRHKEARNENVGVEEPSGGEEEATDL